MQNAARGVRVAELAQENDIDIVLIGHLDRIGAEVGAGSDEDALRFVRGDGNLLAGSHNQIGRSLVSLAATGIGRATRPCETNLVVQPNELFAWQPQRPAVFSWPG